MEAGARAEHAVCFPTTKRCMLAFYCPVAEALVCLRMRRF